MNCKICNGPTQITETCSVKCGMSYRYLRDKSLNQKEMLEIQNIKTNHTIKIKYKLWTVNLKEEPKCSICGSDLSFKRLLNSHNLEFLCSIECKHKHKEIQRIKKTCLICSEIDCKKQKCTSVIRELKKTNSNIEEYIKELKEIYKNTEIDLLLMNSLYKLNLKELPKCKFCSKEHRNLKADCCSEKCANIFKYNKISKKEMIEHFKEKDIPEDFLLSLLDKELGSIYNNKKANIFKCICGKWVINKCSNFCSAKHHFKNFKDFNKNGMKKFIENDLFNLKSAMEYFGCSEKTIRRYKYNFNITNRCKNTIEDNVVNEIGFHCKQNDRTLIYPKEIDILYDNFGIEYDGLYWHSESSVKDNFKNKHLEKTELVEQKGYQLFHIFENEWLNPIKKQIWKSIINNELNKTERIFARKCCIKIVSAKDARDFEYNNHLEGYHLSSIRIGLYYKNELVSLMTFDKSRYNTEIEYEMVRFCSKLNTTVIGAGSKLLKYFERKYNPKSLISYANRRWSQGQLYEKLNFKFVNNTEPNYFYFKESKDEKLYSRNIFQNHKLKQKLEIFDNNLTEVENMFNNGYRRIYDCGNKVYVKYYE